MRARRAAVPLSVVFLDRDGVINRKAPDGEYVRNWSQFEFLPGSLEAIARLAAAPVPIVVVTNQRCVARGLIDEQDLIDIHRRMVTAAHGAGGRIDDVRVCPHDVGCRCRKPATGMFEDAATELGVELDRGVMIGDADSDMVAAARIGALALRIAPACAETPQGVAEDHRSSDLRDAVDWLWRTGRLSGV